jgi:RNA 2',3'-cyclic 3'-phosphodiesterase
VSPNTSTIRCFVALVPTNTTRALFGALLERLAPDPLDPARYRSVALDQLHVTLAFFGALAAPRVDSLRELMTEAARDQPWLECEATELLPLPSSRQPQVLALRLTDQHGLMRQMATRLRAALDPRDRLRFLPHITLGRARRGWAWQPFQPRAIPLAPLVFDRLVLYRSLLEPSGSRYVELGRVELLGEDA